VASLAATFGRGAMTNGWVDIKNADVILAMGGNPAENHPVGFKWFMEARRTRNAKLAVVDPRFTRTAAVADLYAPVRPGSDIAFLLGICDRKEAIPRRLREAPQQRSVHHQRQVRVQRRVVLGVRPGEG
jgi:anaerobic selenocysteine-containing dehydrogenase